MTQTAAIILRHMKDNPGTALVCTFEGGKWKVTTATVDFTGGFTPQEAQLFRDAVDELVEAGYLKQTGDSFQLA